MSWFKRNVGLDWFDLLLHVAVTLSVGMFFEFADAPEEMFPIVAAASLVVLGVRRHFGLKRLAKDQEGLSSGQMTALRLEELEQRLTELDVANARIAELEERVDFTERLLAQGSSEVGRLPAKGGGLGG
jgi:hypothetical protein